MTAARLFHQWTKGRDTHFNNLVDLIKPMKIKILCVSGTNIHMQWITDTAKYVEIKHNENN